MTHVFTTFKAGYETWDLHARIEYVGQTRPRRTLHPTPARRAREPLYHQRQARPNRRLRATTNHQTTPSSHFGGNSDARPIGAQKVNKINLTPITEHGNDAPETNPRQRAA